jgi:hypothetical protein
MSTFVVEHIYKGHPMFETITGVEDINLDLFDKLQTVWVCETDEEVKAVEEELRRKHGERSSQQP